MHIRLRYVECPVYRSGAERLYWHRHRHKLARLPDDSIQRMAAAEQQTLADALPPLKLARGFIGWVIQRYCDSDEYRDLSPGTVPSFTRRAVLEFIESYEPAAPIGGANRLQS
jgi:hypothetical protein